MPARLYVDLDGIEYRAYDTQYAKGKTTRLPLGDASAKYRVFVPKHGPRRLYPFKPGEQHGLTEPELERQLRSSGYASTTNFDASTLTPERSK